MSGHLCLKWNNHSSAFLKSIINIHSKEKYCDATIVCQGKYFPVHRVVLSTCSDYFDEMFERMQCPNPYIVFRDIEPKEMELLLNYMYEGEVNVIQESLPTLIKAAEALKIKGLAVPDDLPTSKESSGKKRSNTSNDTPLSKRRAEERRKRRDSPPRISSESESYSQINSDRNNLLTEPPPLESIQRTIKEEPLDTGYADNSVPNPSHSSGESLLLNKEEKMSTFEEFPVSQIKTEDGTLQGEDGLYEGQSSAWSEYPTSNIDDLPPPDDLGDPDDIYETNSRLCSTENPKSRFQKEPSTSAVELLPKSNWLESNSSIGFPTENRLEINRQNPSGAREEFHSHNDQPELNEGKSECRHKCPFCDYGSDYKTTLRRHVMHKHTLEKPFECSFCPEKFADKFRLNSHERKHTGEKPYECHKCSKKYKDLQALKYHLTKDCIDLSATS